MTPGLGLLCKGIAINIRPIAKINALFNKESSILLLGIDQINYKGWSEIGISIPPSFRAWSVNPFLQYNLQFLVMFILNDIFHVVCG